MESEKPSNEILNGINGILNNSMKSSNTFRRIFKATHQILKDFQGILEGNNDIINDINVINKHQASP